MAVRYLGFIRSFMGLSTDTKPGDSDLPVGSIFEETDSGYSYRWDGEAWVRSGFLETRLFVWNDQSSPMQWDRDTGERTISLDDTTGFGDTIREIAKMAEYGVLMLKKLNVRMEKLSSSGDVTGEELGD